MSLQGGYIKSSHVSSVIRELSEKYGETHEIKRAVNNSVTNSGHGAIFLGTSGNYEGGDRNIRMLIGAHFARTVPFKIGIFGGRCDRGEMTIDTVIRETTEEIFNLKPTQYMIEEIRHFLNNNTQSYFIFQVSPNHKAYSYIFDVSILGDFIRIIRQLGRDTNISYYIPTKTGLTIINNYYKPNVEFTDLSSFNGNHPYVGIDSTIKLSDFLKDRYVSSDRRDTSGLNEIKYLSFASLAKLINSAHMNGIYEIFNFTNNKRESMHMQDFLIKLLKKDIILEILNYSI